jgi:hypothetical protein
VLWEKIFAVFVDLGNGKKKLSKKLGTKKRKILDFIGLWGLEVVRGEKGRARKI